MFLILPGESKRNLEWSLSLSTFLGRTNCTVVRYDHWEQNKPSIDIDKESKKLNHIDLGKYEVVFAKSAGSLLGMFHCFNNGIVLKEFLVMGLPIHYAESLGLPFRQWLIDISWKTTIIQNSLDPVGNFKELVGLVENNSFIKTVEHDEEGHSYNNFGVMLKDYRHD